MTRLRPRLCSTLPVLALMMAGTPVRSSDQPQWGERWTRNQVSGERHLPSAFNPKTGENLRWKVRLGSETHSTPIIADGRVYIGTNNGEPRDPRHTGDRGVLMCFDERDGHLLWQLVVPKREEDPFLDWPKSGIASPVTVEGNRVYVVSNRGEVLCLDPRGLENGNDGPFQEEGRHMTPKAEPALAPGPTDADILWATDLTAVAGIWSHDAAHSSILILGDHLYVNTGTGVDNTHKKIRTPDAPSLVVLDKRTGRLLARDQEHIAPLIFHCTWSSPSSARVGGRTMVFFAGGDGVLYGFEPYSGSSTPDTVAALKAVWRFDLDPAGPKQNVHRYNSNRRESPSNVYGMPVFDHGRLYVAGGGDLWWGKNEAWIKCLDVSHASDKSPPSLVWSSPLEKHVLSTPAVYRGMVFIADCGRNVKCLEAATGRVLWSHETNGEIWGSPMVADGKVYIGTRRGDFWVFEAGREKKILSTVELGSPISGTVTAANGVLYVATMTDLYAIASPR